MEKEIWKKVPNYNRYSASSLGRIRSDGYTTKVIRYGESHLMKRKPQIIKTKKDKDGYRTVSLTDDNGIKRHNRVARIIALAHIPNPNNKPQVNHKFGIVSDDRVSQLEWATISENVKHSFDVLKKSPTYKKVRQLKDGITIHEFNSLEEATKLGFRKSSISSCCHGKLKSHNGYQWEFI
jgi:hypothetical protein